MQRNQNTEHLKMLFHCLLRSPSSSHIPSPATVPELTGSQGEPNQRTNSAKHIEKKKGKNRKNKWSSWRPALWPQCWDWNTGQCKDVCLASLFSEAALAQINLGQLIMKPRLQATFRILHKKHAKCTSTPTPGCNLHWSAAAQSP